LRAIYGRRTKRSGSKRNASNTHYLMEQFTPMPTETVAFALTVVCVCILVASASHILQRSTLLSLNMPRQDCSRNQNSIVQDSLQFIAATSIQSLPSARMNQIPGQQPRRTLPTVQCECFQLFSIVALGNSLYACRKEIHHLKKSNVTWDSPACKSYV
jgi:hypothetical protein